MPNSTRSNKETQLLFSPDPACLERSFHKEARSSSIDKNTCSSLDFRQPPSTQALVPSTDTRSPPYMPNSTRSNKETQLLFSPDPACLERSFHKEARSSSIDKNTCSSLDFRQPPSTQALVPLTDTRSPPSTEDTHLPLTDIFHPTSIDTSVRTSIDTEPRDMVATFLYVMREETCMTRKVICVMQQVRG
ncbi:hypothetical protein F2Q68_00015669 [Brassica cretica]|uniref:Uncharacterized protein n=1 Tax=Brassica cretica TaxID=69181 RepID=A0A8S9HS98_BRACR|nr:hypothetical protein F2Q68_00015669 [Brassica cretica]